MSKVVSLRLSDDQMGRLRHVALGLNRTHSEMAALLLEEALRERIFPLIEFRDTAAGRAAFLRDTRLKIWQVESLARDFEGSASKTAAYLEIPERQVQAALSYAAAFPDEVNAAIEDNEWAADHLAELVPGLQVFTVDATAS